MTAPPPPEKRATPWLLRPAVALPLVLAFIFIVAVLTPEDVTGRMGDSRLTTYASGPLGASGLYEVAQRLGWRVVRRRTPLPAADDTVAIQAVLNPSDPLSAIETHALLDGVRRGAALLYVFESGGPLADSLHVAVGSGLPYHARLSPTDAASAARCPENVAPGLPLWGFGGGPLLEAVRWLRPPPRDTVVFASVAPPAGPRAGRGQPAAVGFAYGRGRIVVVADPDLLRNDMIRVCDWNADVVAVRMLEYLGAGATAPRSRLVFDEYHQGYGLHPGTMRAITVYLGGTPSGHVLAQLAVAGIVLLLALGPRALPPRAESRVQRRSPLEHVDALARAYAQVGATRTAVLRLLHGVRRRLRRTGRDLVGRPDAEFLADIERRVPALTGDVALVRRALDTPVPAHDLEAAGAALRRIESSLTTTTS